MARHVAPITLCAALWHHISQRHFGCTSCLVGGEISRNLGWFQSIPILCLKNSTQLARSSFRDNYTVFVMNFNHVSGNLAKGRDDTKSDLPPGNLFMGASVTGHSTTPQRVVRSPYSQTDCTHCVKIPCQALGLGLSIGLLQPRDAHTRPRDRASMRDSLGTAQRPSPGIEMEVPIENLLQSSKPSPPKTSTQTHHWHSLSAAAACCSKTASSSLSTCSPSLSMHL